MIAKPPTPVRLARPAALGTAAWLVSAALGAVTMGILAARQGVGLEVDAYTAASRLPNLFMVALPPAMAPTLVPLLADMAARRGEASARSLATQALAAVVALGLLLSLGLWLAAPLLAPLLARGPDFLPGSRGLALTTTMLRWQIPNVGLSMLGGALQALHYRAQRFTVPALAPLVQSLATTLCTLLLWDRLGIVAAAVGSLVGPLVMVLMLTPLLPRVLARPQGWDLAALRRLARGQTDIAGAGLLAKAGPLFEGAIATAAGAGTLSLVGFAGQIAGSATRILSIGIATTVFPELAEHRARGDAEAFRRRLSLALRYTLLVALPATAGLCLLAQPLVALLLERGAFKAADSQVLALILISYAPSVALVAAGSTVSSGLFAHEETRAPALVTVATVGLNVALALLLVRLFTLPALGIGLAASLTALVRVALRLGILRRRAGRLDGRRIAVSAARMLAATALMSLAVLGLRDRLLAATLSATAGTWQITALRALDLAILTLVGGLIYAAALKALRATEIDGALAGLRTVLRGRATAS